jgi:RHS repeat-associated protein
MQAVLQGSVTTMRTRLLLAVLLVQGSFAPAEAAVGRLAAMFDVTANGAPAYRIPIELTEGIGDMTPRLAVSYAGPSARGILGVGFSLEGLPSISRCPKSIAQDGVAEAPVVVSTDRYCLGGSRLRLVSGTYGAAGSIYRTELDHVARITAKDSIGNIPGWFQVETRDGKVYDYGKDGNSRLLQGTWTNAPAITWSISRIADRSGNAITFTYDTDQTQRRHRPLQIDYTSSSLGGARYRVYFQYQGADRSDPVVEIKPTGTGGGTHVETRLLDKLLLQHDGSTYREYRFAYGTGAGTDSRLTSVTACVPTDDCLPATTFQWESATAGHGSAVTRAGVGAAMPLDINGDGYDDLVWSASGTWYISWGSASGPQSAISTGIAAYSGPQAMPLDWNGDGRMDLLVPWSDGKWRVLIGTSSGFATPVHAGTGGIPSNTASSNWLIADFNGDGLDDLLRMNTAGIVTVYARINGASGFGPESAVLTNSMLTDGAFNAKPAGSTTIRKPDFNGDGRTDIAFYACEYDWEYQACMGFSWFYAVASGNNYVLQANLPDSGYAYQPNFADFNADGLTDLVYPAQFWGQWCVGFGQGGGGLSVACGASTAGQLLFHTVVADYDGDGYDDLYVSNSGGSPTWRVVRATGSGISTSAIDSGIAVLNAVPRVGDFNGDGLPDLGASVSNTWSTFLHAGVPGERMTSAVDGLGNSVAFQYLPMTHADVYTKGSGALFPVRDHQSSAALVRTMTVTPAGSSPYSVQYKFQGARIHGQGRGYLGMATRELKDLRNGITTTETYEQDFPKTGLLGNRTIRQPAPGSEVVESTTNSYTVLTLDGTPYGQRYLPYLSQSVRNEYEVGGPKNGLWIRQTTDARTVNGWGNTTSGSTTVVDKDVGSPRYGESHVTSVTAGYSENATTWCLALPTSRSETRYLPNGGGSQTRLTHWTVDASVSCRTTQEVVEPYESSDRSLTTNLGYDSCGNISSVSTSPSGLPGLARTTTIDHGSRCQRPVTLTNALGQAGTLGWDYARGVLTSESDPNGLSTQREYDGFGRLTRERGPDLAGLRLELAACDAGNGYCGQDSDVRLRVTQTARDTADAVLRTDELFLDGLGRVRFAHMASLESGASIVETRYDALGRVSQRSQPRFAAGTTYWMNYSYDLLGRIAQENVPIDQGQPSGRVTGYAYEGVLRKVTDPLGNTRSRVHDALGQLRAVIDPLPGSPATQYAYAPFGELASITDAAGNVTGWTHNVRGFVTATSDPDAGNWSYAPNAFGELASQTDAKNQTLSYTYDALGRPLTRAEPEGTTTWTWGQPSDNTPSAKYIGRLKSIASPGGYSETNAYDGFGRIAQQNIVIDGTNYQINRTYSTATGWPETLRYPVSTAGYRLKIAYDYQNGLLKRVRHDDGSVVYWEAVSTNPWGRLQNEAFGNGVQSYTQYDPANGWLFTREAGLGGGTGLVHAQVAWDLNGNFASRQDLLQGITETFSYDPLNRLRESRRNGVTNLEVTLDAIGNVTWRSDVGSYSYHATQRRAVVAAGSHAYGYDANGNMTARDGSTIAYASYNLPTSITAGANSSAFAYGAWRNRSQQVAVTGGLTETTVYVAGLLEQVTKGGLTEYRHLIGATPGTVALLTRRTNGTSATHYLHRDHLGSPELITDAAGAPLVKLSFAAYGARRDSSDWDGPISAADLATLGNTTRHGFTGHEHLDGVGLIHMGGRVYDPLIGRFLSRDPYIDGVASSQGANGYAYVWNNPLSRWDPSGFGGESPDIRTWCNNDHDCSTGLVIWPEINCDGTICSISEITNTLVIGFRARPGCTYCAFYDGLSDVSMQLFGYNAPEFAVVVGGVETVFVEGKREKKPPPATLLGVVYWGEKKIFDAADTITIRPFGIALGLEQISYWVDYRVIDRSGRVLHNVGPRNMPPFFTGGAFVGFGGGAPDVTLLVPYGASDVRWTVSIPMQPATHGNNSWGVGLLVYGTNP